MTIDIDSNEAKILHEALLASPVNVKMKDVVEGLRISPLVEGLMAKLKEAMEAPAPVEGEVVDAPAEATPEAPVAE